MLAYQVFQELSTHATPENNRETATRLAAWEQRRVSLARASQRMAQQEHRSSRRSGDDKLAKLGGQV